MGVHIVVKDPDQLDKVQQQESESVFERVRNNIATCANAVRRSIQVRDAKPTRRRLDSSLANLDGEKTYEASTLCHANEVAQERISDDELIPVKGNTRRVSSSARPRSSSQCCLIDA
ncbi:unnamed protein product [Tilletia controversa]|nr:unnamed protein product [Tilletia controversa]